MAILNLIWSTCRAGTRPLRELSPIRSGPYGSVASPLNREFTERR